MLESVDYHALEIVRESTSKLFDEVAVTKEKSTIRGLHKTTENLRYIPTQFEIPTDCGRWEHTMLYLSDTLVLTYTVVLKYLVTVNDTVECSHIIIVRVSCHTLSLYLNLSHDLEGISPQRKLLIYVRRRRKKDTCVLSHSSGKDCFAAVERKAE